VIGSDELNDINPESYLRDACRAEVPMEEAGQRDGQLQQSEERKFNN
jgi:hypothetical protein